MEKTDPVRYSDLIPQSVYQVLRGNGTTLRERDLLWTDDDKSTLFILSDQICTKIGEEDFDDSFFTGVVLQSAPELSRKVGLPSVS